MYHRVTPFWGRQHVITIWYVPSRAFAFIIGVVWHDAIRCQVHGMRVCTGIE
jgi:hypothetical protein